MEQQISSKELEQTTGLTRQTIQSYVKKGWLPKPARIYSRHGSSLYWPESTIKQLSIIKGLKRIGYKNEIISQILKGDI